MTTLSFKAQDHLKKNLLALADRKGINLSAYIKLLLTKALREELEEVTANGLTMAEEIRIREADVPDDEEGPFENITALKKSLTT